MSSCLKPVSIFCNKLYELEHTFRKQQVNKAKTYLSLDLMQSKTFPIINMYDRCQHIERQTFA